MKSEISLAFEKCKKENRPALITYTVAGDNTKRKSLEILKSISKHADILEIGFPHNAPTADGPQIQNSSYRALKNGIKLKDVFQIVKSYKKSKKAKPCILMGYYQMIFNYGEIKFVYGDFGSEFQKLDSGSNTMIGISGDFSQDQYGFYNVRRYLRWNLYTN